LSGYKNIDIYRSLWGRAVMDPAGIVDDDVIRSGGRSRKGIGFRRDVEGGTGCVIGECRTFGFGCQIIIGYGALRRGSPVGRIVDDKVKGLSSNRGVSELSGNHSLMRHIGIEGLTVLEESKILRVDQVDVRA